MLACIPINVIHEVDEHDERHDQGIDASLQLLLDDLLFLGESGKVHRLLVGRTGLVTQDVGIVDDFIALDVSHGERPATIDLGGLGVEEAGDGQIDAGWAADISSWHMVPW